MRDTIHIGWFFGMLILLEVIFLVRTARDDARSYRNGELRRHTKQHWTTKK